MGKNSRLVIGRMYTRAEIHEIVGGGVQEYMPNINGRVTCICLKKEINPAFNEFADQDLPGGVKAILVGKGDKIEGAASMIKEQHKEPIPTFLKRAPEKWEFIGYYEFLAENSSKAAIRDYSKFAEKNTDQIVNVLFVKEVKDFEPKVVTRKAS